MRKNFFKRGVAPLVPLIVSAVVLVSAMAASFFYQQTPQTTGSKAAPAPTGTIHNPQTCSSAGGFCSAFCINPVAGAADALCPDSLGLTIVCCRTAATRTPTPLRTRTPTPTLGRCPDGTRVGSCCTTTSGLGYYTCVNNGGNPQCIGLICSGPTRTRTPTRVITPTTCVFDTCPQNCAGQCTSSGCPPGKYQCLALATRTPTPLRTRTPTQSGATATRTRTPTPDNCPATCTGNSQCAGCGVGFSCNLLINRCVSTTAATPTRTPTGGSSVATRTPTPGTTCANSCTAFVDAGCEANNCGVNQMFQTRTCTIGGCTLSRCISSSCNVNATPTRTPTVGGATATRTLTPGGATATRTRTPTPCPAGATCAATNTPTRTPTSSACGVSVSLTAIPSTSTTSSLSNVDLRALVTGGSGTITYRFYCLASASTYTRQVSTTTNPYTAVDLCNYTGGGIKTAKVIITSATCNATAQTTITLSGLATPTRTRTPTIGSATTNPTRTRTPTTGSGTTNPTRTRTPTSGGATPTRTRTPTPFGNPTNTPIPIPTDGPTPTSSPQAAGLAFAISLPDMTAGTIQASDAQIMLRDGGNVVEIMNAELVRNGNYFETSSPVFFNSAQNQAYSIFIKTRTSVGREFNGVTLIPSQTQDCINGSGTECGDLVDNRDLKALESGDSDGFDTASGSYNKVDSADLQVISVQFNTQPPADGPSADFNLDGSIDISDLEIIGKNYGTQGD